MFLERLSLQQTQDFVNAKNTNEHKIKNNN